MTAPSGREETPCHRFPPTDYHSCIVNTLVSVVVPAFNAESFIDEAIDSILAQRHRPIEVIVVDDGSKDGTAEVCLSLGGPVTYLHQENQGAAAARNTGVAASRGSILAFLDSDDVWTPDSLEVRLERLDDEPKMIFGLEENFFSETLDDKERARRAVPTGQHRGFNPSAMITTREVFDRVGPFDVTIGVGEFLDWYMRARHAGIQEEIVSEVVAHRRIHATNTGITTKDRSGYLTAVRRSIQRRRPPA